MGEGHVQQRMRNIKEKLASCRAQAPSFDRTVSPQQPQVYPKEVVAPSPTTSIGSNMLVETSPSGMFQIQTTMPTQQSLQPGQAQRGRSMMMLNQVGAGPARGAGNDQMPPSHGYAGGQGMNAQGLGHDQIPPSLSYTGGPGMNAQG